MTAAFLVGAAAPYDLYIQMGASSSVAVWHNTGPFNAATAVSVAGVYQNVWDADTKVNKVTTTSEYNQAYAKNSLGGQVMFDMSNDARSSTIAVRTANGQIRTNTPSAGVDAANKQYVDDGFVAKPNETSFNVTGIMRYNPATGLVDRMPTYQSVPGGNQIPISKNGGRITTNTPTEDLDCTNKKYVDDNFVAKPTSTAFGNYVIPYVVTTAGQQGVIGDIIKIETGNGTNSIARRGANGTLEVGTPTVDAHATTKAYVDNLLVQARFNFTSGSDYILINIYMKKSEYDTIDSIETLAAYVNRKGATTLSKAMIVHMGERGTDTAVTDILQYIVANKTTSFTIVGYARASGEGTFISSSTLTYTSKDYVSL